MGAHLAHCYLWNVDMEPDPLKMPSFDPLYGFPKCKESMMIATQQQMNDAQLPVEQQDYCAHYVIKLMKCKCDKFPNIFGCKHECHDWDYCEHQYYVMCMKEFEREQRLLARKKRIEEKRRAEAEAS